MTDNGHENVARTQGYSHNAIKAEVGDAVVVSDLTIQSPYTTCFDFAILQSAYPIQQISNNGFPT